MSLYTKVYYANILKRKGISGLKMLESNHFIAESEEFSQMRSAVEEYIKNEKQYSHDQARVNKLTNKFNEIVAKKQVKGITADAKTLSSDNVSTEINKDDYSVLAKRTPLSCWRIILVTVPLILATIAMLVLSLIIKEMFVILFAIACIFVCLLIVPADLTTFLASRKAKDAVVLSNNTLYLYEEDVKTIHLDNLAYVTYKRNIWSFLIIIDILFPVGRVILKTKDGKKYEVNGVTEVVKAYNKIKNARDAYRDSK